MGETFLIPNLRRFFGLAGGVGLTPLAPLSKGEGGNWPPRQGSALFRHSLRDRETFYGTSLLVLGATEAAWVLRDGVECCRAFECILAHGGIDLRHCQFHGARHAFF